MYRRFLKRWLDVAGAAAAILLFSPIILVVAAAIRWKCGAPVLFRQRRPGLHERIFTLVKFRTMLPESVQNGRPLTHAERLTPFGEKLRRTSLDELPQLWNILRGDMSFIGPRPLLEEYLACYKPGERARHNVRPGLTGWAQIHGRNTLDPDSRFALDVFYANHASFLLDLKILLGTLWYVLTARGFESDPGNGRSLVDIRSNPGCCEYGQHSAVDN